MSKNESKFLKLKLFESNFYPPIRFIHYAIDLRCEKAEKLNEEKYVKNIGFDGIHYPNED